MTAPPPPFDRPTRHLRVTSGRRAFGALPHVASRPPPCSASTSTRSVHSAWASCGLASVVSAPEAALMFLCPSRRILPPARAGPGSGPWSLADAALRALLDLLLLGVGGQRPPRSRCAPRERDRPVAIHIPEVGEVVVVDGRRPRRRRAPSARRWARVVGAEGGAGGGSDPHATTRVPARTTPTRDFMAAGELAHEQSRNGQNA